MSDELSGIAQIKHARHAMHFVML